MDSRAKFSRLYHHQVEKIYRFVFFKVESKEVAEDLTSEVFRKAWLVYEASFDPTSPQAKLENPRAFLYQVARNTVIDYYRRRPKQSSLSEDRLEIVDFAQDPVKDQDLALDLARIKKALAGVKEEYQEILIQYYLNNLSLREIAKDSGKSLNAAKTSLYRARKALKESLEKQSSL
jgi:RNA polymerase sigma-70 factor, ECF subfamily